MELGFFSNLSQNSNRVKSCRILAPLSLNRVKAKENVTNFVTTNIL